MHSVLLKHAIIITSNKPKPMNAGIFAKPNGKKRSEANKSLFRRVSAWLHLWLGLASGIVVLIVSLTGAIYVFEKEIRSVTEPWRHVEPVGTLLPPSKLADFAKPTLDTMKATGVTYNARGEAAEVISYNRKAGLYVQVFMNPYTGKVINVAKLDRKGSSGKFDFFRFVLNGHRALWLPYPIGRPIVGSSILIFVVMLISGLVLWWPLKWTKSTREKSFSIKWKASFKRVNYDLHNVLGFYSVLLLFIISFTGLVWSYQWFSKSVYWLTSGGKPLLEHRNPLSDTTANASFSLASIDKVWKQQIAADRAEAVFVSIPQRKADVIEVISYLRPGTFYKTNVRHYDQYSLKELKADGPFEGKYAEATVADKLRRMNYDIHIGAVLGIPGKIIALFAALISASLPITGFYIWWGKKNKSKKKKTSAQPVSAAGSVQPVPVKRQPVAVSAN
jgi:uncharacterized iron-regulated membrane protein